MSIWFNCTLETKGINMSELLDGYVYERDIARYDRDYSVSTRSLMSIDLDDFDTVDRPKSFTVTDCGINKRYDNEEAIQKGIKKKEALGFVFKGFNNNDSAEFEKEWDKSVWNSLSLEPVMFEEQGRFLSWGGNYRYCNAIDVAVSKKFPDKVFHFQCWCEGDKINDYYIQNGEVVKS